MIQQRKMSDSTDPSQQVEWLLNLKTWSSLEMSIDSVTGIYSTLHLGMGYSTAHFM